MNIIKWIKEYRKKHCKHKKAVAAIYAIPVKRKFKGRQVTRFNVYQRWICYKCDTKLEPSLIEREVTANQLISKYGIKP